MKQFLTLSSTLASSPMGTFPSRGSLRMDTCLCSSGSLLSVVGPICSKTGLMVHPQCASCHGRHTCFEFSKLGQEEGHHTLTMETKKKGDQSFSAAMPSVTTEREWDEAHPWQMQSSIVWPEKEWLPFSLRPGVFYLTAVENISKMQPFPFEVSTAACISCFSDTTLSQWG